MKIISTRQHAILDYVTVVIFVLAPAILGLSGAPAVVSFILAFVHLAMTVSTDMPLSLFKLVPLKLHALVEAIVGPVLIVGAVAFVSATPARWFYIVMGAIIIVVRLLSSYETSNEGGATPR
jgi:hypothetical protein